MTVDYYTSFEDLPYKLFYPDILKANNKLNRHLKIMFSANIRLVHHCNAGTKGSILQNIWYQISILARRVSNLIIVQTQGLDLPPLSCDNNTMASRILSIHIITFINTFHGGIMDVVSRLPEDIQ